MTDMEVDRSCWMSATKADQEIFSNKWFEVNNQDDVQPSSYKKQPFPWGFMPSRCEVTPATPQFPHESLFSVEQQVDFLAKAEMYMSRGKDGSCFVSPSTNNYIHFKSFEGLVRKEQKEFINFALTLLKTDKRDVTAMPRYLQSYIERALHYRQCHQPRLYPPLYRSATSIPFGQRDATSQLQFHAELLALGELPQFTAQPPADEPLHVPMSSGDLDRMFPADETNMSMPPESNENTQAVLYHTPVSRDGRAAKLAEDQGIHLVLSSSALQRLLDCHPYHPENCATPRYLPVTVKEIQGAEGNARTMVFVDKALPPSTMNLYEKKMWVCRRAVRTVYCANTTRPYSLESKKLMKREQDTSGPVNAPLGSEVPWQQEYYSELLPWVEPPALPDKPDFSTMDTQEWQISEPSVPATSLAAGHNLSYALLTLRREPREGESEEIQRLQEPAQDELQYVPELRLLIRTSHHAYEWDNRARRARLVHTNVHLERQPELGASASTISESCRDWLALFLRPGSSLCRVRVDAASLAVVQTQRLGVQELATEAQSRGFFSAQALGSVHGVLGALARLQEPGNYLLQLLPASGEAVLYSPAPPDSTSEKLLDLRVEFGSEASATLSCPSVVPPSLIDPLVSTPHQRASRLIPATFPPAIRKPKQTRHAKKKNKKNKKRKTQLISQEVSHVSVPCSQGAAPAEELELEYLPVPVAAPPRPAEELSPPCPLPRAPDPVLQHPAVFLPTARITPFIEQSSPGLHQPAAGLVQQGGANISPNKFASTEARRFSKKRIRNRPRKNTKYNTLAGASSNMDTSLSPIPSVQERGWDISHQESLCATVPRTLTSEQGVSFHSTPPSIVVEPMATRDKLQLNQQLTQECSDPAPPCSSAEHASGANQVSELSNTTKASRLLQLEPCCLDNVKLPPSLQLTSSPSESDLLVQSPVLGGALKNSPMRQSPKLTRRKTVSICSEDSPSLAAPSAPVSLAQESSGMNTEGGVVPSSPPRVRVTRSRKLSMSSESH